MNSVNPTQKQHSGLGIAGMVIGIISLLMTCFLIGGLTGIVGLILSIVGVTQKNRKTGMAIAGIVLNSLAVIIVAVMFFTFSGDTTESNSNAETKTPVIVESTIESSEDVSAAESESATNLQSSEIQEIEPSESSSTKMSKDEVIALCEEIPYKTLARYPEENTGKYIKLTVQINQVLQGGLFDSNKYYRVFTNNDGYGVYFSDEYFMYDFRIDDETRLLEDDIITVYGEFVGVETITRALTGLEEEVPAIKAYYIDILDEE